MKDSMMEEKRFSSPATQKEVMSVHIDEKFINMKTDIRKDVAESRSKKTGESFPLLSSWQ